MGIQLKGQPIEQLEGAFNKEIAEVMRRRGLRTLDEFADYANIGRTTMYNVVLGRRSRAGTLVKPSLDTLVALAGALNIPLHELVYRLEPDALGADLVDKLPLVQNLSVRVAGWCGAGPSRSEALDEQVWVEGELGQGRTLTAFRVHGDSMLHPIEPIHHGDTVIVDRDAQVVGNYPVVARLKAGGYVCKVYKDDQYGQFLQSGNPTHTNGTPSYIPMDAVAEIVGRVIRVIHDIPARPLPSPTPQH